MTTYELLKTHEHAIRQLAKNGYRMPYDAQFLAMYEQYLAMVAQGDGKEYVIAYLTEKFKCARSSFYRIKDRMEREAVV